MAKAKSQPKLSQRDIKYVSLITDAAEQRRVTKRLLADKAEGMERSKEAFAKVRAARKARIEAEPEVLIRNSKRGKRHIVASGGGMYSSLWLSLAGAQALIAMVPQIKALIPKLEPKVTETEDVDGDVDGDVESDDQE
jgi:predicted PP-loop superfamily ATPase